MDDAVTWATTPSHGASSLLLPTKQDGHYLAFDYLIDLDGLRGVPQATWDTLIQRATPQQAFDIGEAAAQRFQHTTAIVAFGKAAEGHVPDADIAMAEALGYFDRTEATQILTDLLDQRRRSVDVDELSTLRIRLLLAQRMSSEDHSVRARSMSAELTADLERMLGPDHAYTLRSRFWMAWALGESGDFTNAFREYSEIACDQCRALGPDHPDMLLTRHGHVYHLAASGEFQEAFELGKELIDDMTRALGADDPRTFQCRNVVAHATAWAGDPAHAAYLCAELARDRERVLGVRQLHTLMSRYEQASYTALAGEFDHATEQLTTFLVDWRQAHGISSSWSDTARTFLVWVNGRASLDPPYAAFASKRLSIAWTTCRQLLGAGHPLATEIRHLLTPLLSATKY